MKPTRTWILIADGSRARVLEQVGKTEALHEVPGLRQEIVLPRSHDLGDDRPGRGEPSVGTGRHAFEPTSDPHRELKRAFAAQLAEQMAERLTAHTYDRLVIVAPPVTLGDLRHALSAPVRAVLKAEYALDLTKTPDPEVAGHITDALV